MILFDFINDEAPLFSMGINQLCSSNYIKQDDIQIITMGKRWHNFWGEYTNKSMSNFFHSLDDKKINIPLELKRIRQEYTTQNLFAVDRLLINESKKFQEKILVYTFLFYENIFSTLNVTHYFTTGIAYMYNLVSYEVAKKYSIKHISFYDIRNPNEKRTAISYDVYNTFNEVEETFKEYSSSNVTDEMLERVHSFKSKPSMPTYMKNLGNKQTLNFILIKEFFIRFRKYYFEKRSSYDYFTRNPFSLSYIKIKKLFFSKMILLKEKKYFDLPKMKHDEYFLYPIHMQPEASTLVLAPYYVDQLSNIINISKTLPAGVYLYVKEHKSALGERFTAFYKDLKKYPNIKLISHNENTFELIKHSKGIITLSSTVGWEALFFEKPVITLGNVFYNATKLTIQVNSYQELSKTIDQILSNSKYSIDSEHTLKLAFFQNAMLTNSYPFEFNVYKLDITNRLLNKNNINNFAKCLLKLINK